MTNSSQTVFLTKATKERLEKRMAELQKEKTAVSKEIGIAADHGDLKENAEYHAAREKQGNLMAEEARLMEFLSKGHLIDDIDYSNDDSIRVGKKAILLNVETDEEIEYTILGELEADPAKNILSVNAPLCRSLLGKCEGDTIIVRPPRKKPYELEVLEVIPLFN